MIKYHIMFPLTKLKTVVYSNAELRETPPTIKNKTMIVETENILGVGIGKKEKSSNCSLRF